MVSTSRAFGSLFATIFLLLTSVALLHQTHEYSSSVAPHTTRLSWLAVLCPLLSVVTYISPVGSVLAMRRTGETLHFPIQVVFAQGLQNVACLAYGLQIQNEALYLSSAVGILFQLTWITAWYSVLRLRLRRTIWKVTKPLLLAIVCLTVTILVTYLLTLLPSHYVGLLSCALTLALCVSPLATLGIIVRSMNSASIPLAMSVVMLIANAAWAVYGIMLEDAFVFLPSIFGFCVTVFQLLVSAWCNGLLFYDLTFLKWLYAGYQAVEAETPPDTPPRGQHRSVSLGHRDFSP